MQEESRSKDHQWPAEGEHLFGKWYPENRTTQYRSCVHPYCNKVEKRSAPKG